MTLNIDRSFFGKGNHTGTRKGGGIPACHRSFGHILAARATYCVAARRTIGCHKGIRGVS